MSQSTAHTEPICRKPIYWFLAAIFIGVFLSAPAASATPQEGQQGAQILGELETGKLQCSDASPADFELVGEYAMGRMFGSPAQHEAMNQMMSRMMGGYGYGSSTATNDEDFDGPSAAAMVGMMAVLIGAVALALFLLARRHPSGPLDTLKRRFAKGELTAEEYQERKRLLEGS